jgi:hypothetical protein
MVSYWLTRLLPLIAFIFATLVLAQGVQTQTERKGIFIKLIENN